MHPVKLAITVVNSKAIKTSSKNDGMILFCQKRRSRINVRLRRSFKVCKVFTFSFFRSLIVKYFYQFLLHILQSAAQIHRAIVRGVVKATD